MALGTAASIAITAVSAGVSAYSSLQQGKVAKDVASFNAEEQRHEADRVDRESRREATRMQKNKARTLASLEASFGKSGLELSGTLAEVLAEKTALLNMEIEDMKRAGGAAATRLRRQSSLTETAGRKARQAGVIAAGTDLLSGAGDLAGVLNG